MQNLLSPLRAWTRPAFLLAGLIYIPLAAILGFMARSATDQYGLLIASLDSAIRAFAFFALLGLLGQLLERSRWLATIGAVLAALGLVGSSVFAFGTLGEYFGLFGTPRWVMAIIPLMISGFVAMILAAISTFHQDDFSNLLSGLLLLPFVIFILQFAIGAGLPTWSILIFIGAQAATMLAIGLMLPEEVFQTLKGVKREPSAA